MTESVERFHARSYWLAIIAAWASFLAAGVLALDPFVLFVIEEAKWLNEYSPTAGAWLRSVPAWGWNAINSLQVLGFGVVLVVSHEASHIIAHRLFGTHAHRIRFSWDKWNPRVFVEGFEPWPVKVLATAAPLATTLLPAAGGLALTWGSTWSGLFALTTALAWGICASDVNVLINYLRIPRDALIRVSLGGEVTEWYISDGGR